MSEESLIILLFYFCGIKQPIIKIEAINAGEGANKNSSIVSNVKINSSFNSNKISVK